MFKSKSALKPILLGIVITEFLTFSVVNCVAFAGYKLCCRFKNPFQVTLKKYIPLSFLFESL